MHITVIGIATLLCMLYLAGCANNHDVWIKKSEMIERSVDSPQDTSSTEQKNISAKSEKDGNY